MSRPAKYKRVSIDGAAYVPAVERPIDEEARAILTSLYNTLGAETYYDPLNESTRKFAAPLYDKMKRLNELLEFRA